ncbi:MAG: hypothetical protein KF852_16705 [Saprospiraceae bacterium]|nr:hypothetical protein [Saprospiraceae bacterium]
MNYVSINFNLSGGGDITQVIEGGTVTNRGNRFANVAGGITEGISKGNSAYKAASELVGVADKLLVNSANKRLTPGVQNTLPANGFSNASVALGLNDIRDLHQMHLSNNVDAELNDAISWLFPKKVTSVVPDWIKTAVPFANTAFALLDFIIGGGKSTPPKPMHFQANFQFEGNGKLTDESLRPSIAFRVPGSSPPQNGAPVYNPVYDKVLGVLNLVEQPVLYQAESNHEVVSSIFDPYLDMLTEELRWKKSLKSAALRYAFNPSSGLNTSDIRGAYFFKNCNGSANFGSASGLIMEEPGVFRTPYMPIACLESYTLNFIKEEQTIIKNVSSQNPDVEVFSTGYTPCPSENIELHLMAKLISPAGKEAAWAARYNVEIKSASYFFEDTPPNPFLNVQENVEVEDLDEIMNNNILSWNPIIIKGDVLVTPGRVEDFLNANSPQQVIVTTDPISGIPVGEQVPVNQILPGSTLQGPLSINRLPNCGSNPPVDAAWLADFCHPNNMRYNPILARSRPVEEVAADTQPVPPSGSGDARLAPTLSAIRHG